MVGLAGEGQNFDGNGSYVRFQTGGGDQTCRAREGEPGNVGALFGNAIGRPLGTRPRVPGAAAAVPARRAVRDSRAATSNGAAGAACTGPAAVAP